MLSPSVVEASPTPPSRANSLANAFEALRQAKAMLRGEQSPLASAQNANGASPRPSPSPPQQRCTESLASSLDGARHSYGVPMTSSCSGSSNGATQSRSRSGPSVSLTTSRHSRNCDDTHRAGSMSQDAHPEVASKGEEANEGSSSPEAQPPTPAFRRTESEGTRRREQHVQFDVPPPSADDERPHSVTSATPSLSPSPARPSIPPPTFSAPRVGSAVDVRTVQLLQLLTYEEIQQIHDVLLQQQGDTPLRSDEWRVPSSLGATEPITSVERQTLTDNWMTQHAPSLWGTEPPVQLDVDAQLRYAELFYTQLMQEEGADEGAGSEGHEANRKGEGNTAAVPPSADRVSAADKVQNGPGKSLKASVEGREEDDELTLSPIAKQSVFNSPARPHHLQEGNTEEFAMDMEGERSSYKPMPAAVPPILISPEKQRCRSSALRPQIVLSDSDHQPYCSSPLQHRMSGCRLSPLTSPSVLSIEHPRGLSAGPSRSTTSWSLKDFDVGRRIGCGATGRTYLAREKLSKVVVALKCVQKASVAARYGDADVTRAARLHMSAGRRCPHIVKLYTFFEDAQRVYLTLEYAADGDLARYAAQQPYGRLPEAQVQRFVYQLTCALKYLHGNQVIHCAVAPRHVLIKDQHTTVKLGSCTQATRPRASDSEKEIALSSDERVDYVAPEVLCGRGRSFKSDMWSLGVLTYELLCGYLPFEHVCTTQAKHLICTGVVYYPQWVSATARSFVGSLLCVEEAGRCSAVEALQHPFLSPPQRSAPPSTRTVSPPRTGGTFASTKSCIGSTAGPGPADEEIRGEDAAASPLADESIPVSRGLSVTFAQVGEEESRMHGAKTAESSASPSGAMLTSSFLQLGSGTSHIESITMSSSTPSQCGGHSASGDNDDASVSTSTLSNAPTAATTPTPASDGSSPFAFLGFALPSHSWRSGTQPHGPNNGGGMPSVALTSPHSVSSVITEEAGGRPRRRSSATSVKSAALSSHPSLTRTLSDVSASLLSVTCAPTGAAGPLVGPDGPGSSSKGSSHRRPLNNRAAPTVSSLSSAFLADNEARVPCSVTISSLTAASPNPQSEWGTSPLDVEVSASSSNASSAPGQLTRHESSSLLSAVAGARNAAAKGEQVAPQWPRSLPSLTAVATTNTAVVPPTTDAVKAKKGNVRGIKKRRAGSGLECAMRLDFDTLSDDDG
ncbi:putative protein kinase [Leptomonas pyrrhocoris]|uniref:Protein kinase domain-containing protein n=1 Tax=Leptomonas pyrrhocoris TaxID=157538 RepID=A0A0N0DRF8_LEPPY|nr:putative protein kinase [Leptomonas pyrrhocoris]KPA74081.1 putative protein kinase [Leptomonas pyrrhocoris]|eukprot:XP_015652520.1 putative protein kinase [Leptomonas pyrrhocoris]